MQPARLTAVGPRSAATWWPATGERAAVVWLRGRAMMLARDAAALYGVEPQIIKQTIQRHARRFPPDFVVTLTTAERRVLGHSERYAFSAAGLVMLAMVLPGRHGEAASVAFARLGVRLRQTVVGTPVHRLVDVAERRYEAQEISFRAVYPMIRNVMLSGMCADMVKSAKNEEP